MVLLVHVNNAILDTFLLFEISGQLMVMGFNELLGLWLC